ncbi:MAG TPA: TlpA disulfide reductase family protein [Chitinophagaceae bacterium]|nr:TlpA disulfide reductase family protein [Chitinophagaceae bacterium]
MRLHTRLLLLLSIIAGTTHAQNDRSASLNIGDPFPPIQVRDWLKGKPFQSFEKGQVYVLEFWATWCHPCIAFMPHLSALANEYKDKLTILGIDIYEEKSSSLEKVKAFVDSMGKRMDYVVATMDSSFTGLGWCKALKSEGIPLTLILDTEGRLAWIGHPKDMDEVLHKIVNNDWDIHEALAKRNLNKYLAALDDSLRWDLMKYDHDTFKPGSIDKPDSTLLMIDEIIKNEPRLKYATHIAYKTFSCLLQTNSSKAYEYGKVLMVTPVYEDPPYGVIVDAINEYAKKIEFPAEIYELGAAAYQAKIDHYGELGNMNIPDRYSKMADMYWRAKNKLKAIDAIQKAMATLKNEKDFSPTELALYESLFQQYKKM